jgi:hypothetical protein
MTGKSQSNLFHESLSDALKEVIMQAGGTKFVGSELWPEISPDAAHRKLLDCLNDNRAEKLSPDQVLFLVRLGRKVGCHSAINYLTGEAGYSTPTPIEPEDEKAQLQRDFIQAAQMMKTLTEKMSQFGISA